MHVAARGLCPHEREGQQESKAVRLGEATVTQALQGFLG